MHIPSTRRGKASFAAVLGFALVAAPLAASPALAATGDPETITLLNINDFHGRIDANTVKWAGTIEQLRAAGGEANTALLSAGDNISASLFASASQNDDPTIDVLNALNLQASAVGNHEFDKGFADLTGHVNDRANWTYLGANVYNKGTTTPALPEYQVVTLGPADNPIKVAVIGAVTQETPTLVSPAGIANLDVGDPVAAVNRVVGELDALPAADKPDVYVAEYHEGGPISTDSLDAEEAATGAATFTNIVNNTSAEVDAIFTGHTHQKYAFDAPVTGGGTRPVLETGEYGSNIGKVTLTVDPDTDVVSAHTVANVAQLIPASDQTSAQLDAQLISTYPRVSTVNDITQAALAQAAIVGNKPIATITSDITRAYTGAIEDRGAESTLGNLVAEALVDTLKAPEYGSADIGIVNPGGLRTDLTYKGSSVGEGDGVVTYGEANSVLPFVNNLWTTSLTGAQVKATLEQQWQTTTDGTNPSRAYLQLGLSKNVSYTYNDAAAQGSHITSISINGAPIDLTKSYRIGTFSFLTAGGDNFRELAKGTGAKDTGLVDRDVWISYLTKSSPITPSYARRAVGATVPTGVIPQGTKSSITLSKLDLTSLGSPKNASVFAAFEGSKAAPVVSTVTDGNSTVAFTVPYDAPANATLVLTVSPSNTVVRIPITTSIAIDSTVPTISGDNKVGSTLKARVGTWDPRPVALTYRWYLDGKPIAHATTKSLKLTKAMKGHIITFRTVGKKTGYPTKIEYSKPIKVYLAFKKTPRPTITGTASVGHKLTAVAHMWSPKANHAYQWYRNGVAIPKAVTKSYKLTAADKGKKITVKVFGIRSGYFTETETRSVAKIK